MIKTIVNENQLTEAPKQAKLNDILPEDTHTYGKNQREKKNVKQQFEGALLLKRDSKRQEME